MITAYREFQHVTQELVLELRCEVQLKVIQDMDSYTKRSVIRNLDFATPYSKDELFCICDQFFAAQFDTISKKKSSARIDLPQFRIFFGKLADWANIDPDLEEQASRSTDPKAISGSGFVDKMFTECFDEDQDGYVDFPGIVKGLIPWTNSSFDNLLHLFFSIHDSDKDQILNREETLQLSESLLFINRRNDNDKFLASISGFMIAAISVLEKNSEPLTELSFSMFKLLVESDASLSEFFSDFSETIYLYDTKSIVEQKLFEKTPSKTRKNSKWTEKLKFKASTSKMNSEQLVENSKKEEPMEILDQGSIILNILFEVDFMLRETHIELGKSAIEDFLEDGGKSYIIYLKRCHRYGPNACSINLFQDIFFQWCSFFIPFLHA